MNKRENQEKVLAAWRAPENQTRQTRFKYFAQGKRCCVIGLAAEVLGIDVYTSQGARPVAAALGIDTFELQDIMEFNDEQKLTFSEIADRVAPWFDGE